VEADALFLRVVDFFEPGRHLDLGAAVNDIHFLRTQALGAAGRVHRDIAAADDRHPAADLDRRVAVGELVRLHQVDTGQELIGRVDAVQVLARDAHEGRQAGACADKDRFKSVREQVVEREDTADDHVRLDLDAILAQRVDLLLDQRLRQTKFGNAIHQHAAGDMECLENGDLVTQLGQVAGTGQAGRTGADDRHLAAVGTGPQHRAGARLLGVRLDLGHMPVGREPLEPADADGLALLAADAQCLALRLLRTDAAADGRQAVRLDDLLVGALEIALGQQHDELGNGDIDRAARDTGAVLAVQAAGRLLDGLLLIVAERDFGEILVADFRLLLRHRHFLA